MANDDDAIGTRDDEQSEFPAPVWSRGEPNVAGETHVGVVRNVNQDAFGRFDDPDRAEILLVVADGLGGHRGGEVASRMAVDRLGEFVLAGEGDGPTRLERAIARANDVILTASRKDHTLDGMGTTVVCLLLAEDGPSTVAHVGDSRLYRLRGGAIDQLTEDHSLVATLVREGVLAPEDARDDPRRNQILRALGVREDVEIDLAPVELRPGDHYLLCSDGLHGMIEDDAIAELVHAVARPETAVNDLIDAANAAGGTDNVTCVLAKVPEPIGEPGLLDKANALLESTRAVFGRRSNEDPDDA
ncbi:MAG: Stp1/IreP family PP2C-type Ser/Thr phosphatase [Myxococcota bacterium]